MDHPVYMIYTIYTINYIIYRVHNTYLLYMGAYYYVQGSHLRYSKKNNYTHYNIIIYKTSILNKKNKYIILYELLNL